MKLSRTNFIFGILTVFIIFLFLKSAANILKTFNEIKNPPGKEVIVVCPPKTPAYFVKLNDGQYLYALYRYKSLGVKCAK